MLKARIQVPVEVTQRQWAVLSAVADWPGRMPHISPSPWVPLTSNEETSSEVALGLNPVPTYLQQRDPCKPSTHCFCSGTKTHSVGQYRHSHAPNKRRPTKPRGLSSFKLSNRISLSQASDPPTESRKLGLIISPMPLTTSGPCYYSAPSGA